MRLDLVSLDQDRGNGDRAARLVLNQAMPPKLRILFFGTAELACASLAALARTPDFDLVGVVTQPDRPKGRELRLQPSAVKVLALQLGLPVLQPERCKTDAFLQQARELAPQVGVVVAYGQILPPALLALPPHGCLNVHASLLPKYRGAAPIQWALLDGEPETGVTIMRMDAGLDTGDLLTQQATSITEQDDARTLHDRLAAAGAELLVRTIPGYIAARTTPRKQNAEAASYARKITKEDGRLDWRQPARTLWFRIRALTPWPGTYTFLGEAPKRVLLKIWQARVLPGHSGPPGGILQADKAGVLVACGQDALLVTELQREGGRRLPTPDFLAGHPLAPGRVLG